jgi:hypothetical protein
MFDEYDLKNHAVPYMRHLLHESSEIAYCAFKGQLGWQTGLNISHRFYQLQHCEAINAITKLFRKREFSATAPTSV